MTNTTLASEQNCLYQNFRLPCGAVLKNRLIKSAMSDSLGDGSGKPTELQVRLYELWALGGVAASIIGEVQIDPRYPEKPGNLVMRPGCDEALLKQLAQRASIDNAQLWPQIGHAGALAYAPISRAKGPSALDLDGLQCEGLSTAEVAALPASYASTAAIAKRCGFGGVQLHAGHGFLLSQFLSPLFNRRRDAYGGAIEARARVMLEIVEAIREAVGPDFPIAIKINSSDQLEGGLSEEDALIAIALLDKTSIDLIDISGGTYFPGAKSSSDSAVLGVPYFLDFAGRARGVTSKPLMVTGGFKKRQQAVDAIRSGLVDFVGLARALVVEPELANQWRENNAKDPVFPRFLRTPEGGVTAWYTMQMTQLAEGREDSLSLDLDKVLHDYNARDEARSQRWLATFADVS